MKTGTDISIQECRVSGYPVVEHGKRPMDPSKDYNLTISNPESWYDNGKPKIGSSDLYSVDTFISYQDLWDTFENQGEGIKDYCDFENCPLPAPYENPSFHDFVHLASIIHPYCGIE